MSPDRRWIPVTERLPDAETLVLIAVPDEDDCRIELGCVDKDELWFDFDDAPVAVTHWMELPEPPEAAERTVEG